MPHPARPKAAGSRSKSGLLWAALLAAAIALALVARALLSTPEDPVRIGAAPQAGGSVASPGADRPEASMVAAKERDAVDADPERSESRTSGERTRAASEYQRELEGALWVEGEVVFPEGTPLDEHVTLEARGRDFDHGPAHSVEVKGDGRFRLAFANDTNYGRIALEGRYLWLDGTFRVRPGREKERVRIQPILGGRIEGTLRRADGGALPEEGLEVEWSATPDTDEHYGRANNADSRVFRDPAGGALRFEVDALPPGVYTLKAAPDGFLSAEQESLRVSAGETQTLDLVLYRGGRVSGRVVDPQGEPVAGASLKISLAQELEGQAIALTNKSRHLDSAADGSFAVEGLTPGRSRIHVEAEGYLELDEDVDLQTIDGEVAGLTLTLQRGGEVGGRVVFADGRAAPGVKVSIKTKHKAVGNGFEFDFGENERQRIEVTDAEGRFEASAMGPGPYELIAAMPNPADGGRLVAHQPEAAEGARGVLLTLGEGYSVSGRALNARGEPIERYSVSARPSQFMPFLGDLGGTGILAERVRSEDGTFTLTGLLPGDWIVSVNSAGHVSEGERTLHVPPSQGDLEFRLQERGFVTGRVIGPDGEGVYKADVRYSVKGGDDERSDGGDTKSGRDGGFRLRLVAPGLVEVSAQADGFAPSGSAFVTLAPGATAKDVVLVLQRGATIAGQVQQHDGSPAKGSQVFWHLEGSNENGDAHTDSDGKFRIEGIPPGKVMLSTSVKLEPKGEAFGELVQQVSDQRVLAMGDVWAPILRPDAPLGATTRIELQRNGEPWPRATLNLSFPGDWSASARTDEAGVATAFLPPSGNLNYSIQAQQDTADRFAWGSSSLSGLVELHGQSTIRIEVETGGIYGKVITPPDVELPWSWVSIRPLESETSTGFGRTPTNARVQDDGTFRSETLVVGRYAVSAGAPSFGSGPDYESEAVEVDVRIGEDSGPITLTLALAAEGEDE